mmetsp:Transcript_26600/g.73072  ORF Transcript_26600/g.73072 Transcript_26600/m.73072 type:complete len:211 (-) Transcript_26600:2-634(-)
MSSGTLPRNSALPSSRTPQPTSSATASPCERQASGRGMPLQCTMMMSLGAWTIGPIQACRRAPEVPKGGQLRVGSPSPPGPSPGEPLGASFRVTKAEGLRTSGLRERSTSSASLRGDFLRNSTERSSRMPFSNKKSASGSALGLWYASPRGERDRSRVAIALLDLTASCCCRMATTRCNAARHGSAELHSSAPPAGTSVGTQGTTHRLAA